MCMLMIPITKTCKLLKHISIGLLELIMFFEYRSLDILLHMHVYHQWLSI